jgi:hypothetical protein
MSLTVQKDHVIYGGHGYTLFGTNDLGIAWLEWDREEDCRLAAHLNDILKKHSLASNLIAQQGAKTMLVKRLRPIQVSVKVHSTPHDTTVSLINSQGEVVDKAQAMQADHAKASLIERMQDVSLHLVRSLRAHLLPNGVKELTLNLSFGLGKEGDCVMQVVNPTTCDFGIANEQALLKALGGNQV